MQCVKARCLILPFVVAILAVATTASATPGANETEVTVRKDCGSPAPDNCFTTLAAATSWVWGTASPSASKRILIDIGPGVWSETWQCAAGNPGYVTLRGAGRDATILEGTGAEPSGYAANDLWVSEKTMSFNDCTDIEVKDMTVKGKFVAAFWEKGGSSVWTNVDLISTGEGSADTENAAWGERNCDSTMTERPTHYFFGSRLIVYNHGSTSIPAAAYYGICSDTWFYGGEISYFSDVQNVGFDTAVQVHANSTVRVYGSLVRAEVTSSTVKGSNLSAVEVNSGDYGTGAHTFGSWAPGQFHMHGGIINVTVNPAATVVGGYFWIGGIYAQGSGAFAHTLDTAFIVKTPAAIDTWRVWANPGNTIDAPLLWQAGTTPPLSSGESNKIMSQDGEDLFVETDCGADGDCNGGGSEAHLMVYNDSLCTAAGEPWLDTVTGRCRNDVETPVSETLDAHQAALDDLEARVSALEGP